jgi:hypothetical protein
MVAQLHLSTLASYQDDDDEAEQETAESSEQ